MENAKRGSTWRVVGTLAWRHLWRNHRRTIIMLAAIAVGSWAMIFMTALTRGMVDDMIKTTVKNYLGHVQIHHPAYLDDPSINNAIAPANEALKTYLNDAGLNWGMRIRVPAVISSERESLGVILMGVEPDKEAALSGIAQRISGGRYLESADDNGIILGAKMARRLETELGKRVVIMSQDPDNNIADRGFRVVGIYSAEMPSQEETYVFVGLQTAQTLLAVGDQVSEIEIQGSDFREVDDFYQRIAALVTNSSVQPWYEVDTYLGSMLAVMDGTVLIYVIVIFLVLSFGLVNTLVMAVFERVREIGLLLALGMRPGAILRQILLETVFLLVLGLLIGNLLVLATVWPLRDGIDVSVVGEGMAMMGASSRLTPALYMSDVVLANVVVILLGVLSGILPALRASRYDPVRALNKI